jgi:hypothetical protein
LVIRFIEHFNVTTSKCSAIVNSHPPQFTARRTTSSQSAVSSPVDVPLLPGSRPRRLATISHQPPTFITKSKLVPNTHVGPLSDFYYCQTVSSLLICGALSDKRTDLSFTTAAGSRQRSPSPVGVPHQFLCLQLLDMDGTENTSSNSFSIVVVQLLPWEHICLRKSYLVTAFVYLLNSRSLASNESVCSNIQILLDKTDRLNENKRYPILIRS